MSQKVRNAIGYKAHSFLDCHKIKAFYTLIDDVTLEEGARALMQASGIGKLRPNIVLMGYKTDWRLCEHAELIMYFNIMQ